MADEELSISIRALEPGDRLTGLSLGAEFEPLKRFLRRNAASFHQQKLARTYGVFRTEDQRVIAYVTLVCGEIETAPQIGDRLGDDIDFRYGHCPAVKIARLAVDRRYSGRGLGRMLVDFSLGIAVDEISTRVGCRFVVVDAKRQAIPFYADKCGFTLLDTPENRARDCSIMFVDLHKATA